MAEGVVPQRVAVSVRRSSGRVDEGLPWSGISVGELREAAPWRTFRWHQGQVHYSGYYWSSTMNDHVIYESRLELSRLLFADFDPSVSFISAQPFLLCAEVAGKKHRHIPDYLLVTDRGPVVVDVKPWRRLSDPKVQAALDWAARAVKQRGWEYEIASELPATRLENIRFLAGYRRSWLFDQAVVTSVRDHVVEGMTISEAVAAVSGWPRHTVRAVVLHLLWSGTFRFDLDMPLESSLLRLGAR